MTFNVFSKMKEVWKWLITSRYVRALEAEVERLRAENRALMNSILGIAGIPPVLAAGEASLTATTGAKAASNGKLASAAAVATPVRKRSWQQVNRALEIEAAKKKEPGKV